MPSPESRVPPGILIAAPSSGSGKTSITLALLRRFRQLGRAIPSVKVGPDYIDPAFHRAASGRACTNLDSWAMRPETLGRLIETAGQGADFLLGEGVMGLFDGAANGEGSTADLAALTGWPVVLVVDARGMAASAAAVVHGFRTLDSRIELAGVIFNRVGSDRHADMLEKACEPLDVPVLGMVRQEERLALPSRHLGLVQAEEHHELERFLDAAARDIAGRIDCERLLELASSGPGNDPALGSADSSRQHPGIRPLGQRIAVARDTAFAFSYPFLLDAWRDAGAEISLFSPLADEAPEGSADAVFLPGGYPELHAELLTDNRGFLSALKAAADRGACVYGECGGYMLLGQGLVDASGKRHAMAGLLPVETSFAPAQGGETGRRRMVLGYRRATLLQETVFGSRGAEFAGHEFHYAHELLSDGGGASPRSRESADALFQLRDARGQDLGSAGLRIGNVMGSFLHLIDSVTDGR